MRQREDARLAGREQLLHREFRRGREVARAASAVRGDEFGRESGEMCLVTGRELQRRYIDLDEMLPPEELPAGGGDAGAHLEERPAVFVEMRGPPGRGLCYACQNRAALLSPRMRRFIDPHAAPSNPRENIT